jgi:hypothetical protein
MKPKTRDNLIYLAVGISIAAFVWADFFYVDSHSLKMWMPSRLAFRSVYTTALIWYVVLKGIRQTKQTFVRVLAWLLFATLLHLTIVLASRQIIEELPGISFAALWVVELYFIFFVTEKFAIYLTRTHH